MAALPENDRIAGPFIATAGQTDFPADFPLLDSVGLRARIVRETGSIDLEEPAIVPVDAGEAGFTARMAAPCFVGDRVWIYSALPAARSRAHTPNGAVRTRTLEDDAEGMQAQLQELRRDLGRTVQVDIGQPLPSPGDIMDAAEAASRIRTKLEKASLAVMPEAAQAQVFVANRDAPGDEYGGVFEWVAGDQSASVAADPGQGVWVAPASISSGALGAWKRVFNGPIDPVWFGGRTSAAVNAALAYARATGENRIRATGVYVCSETILYRGGSNQGVFFDASAAEFHRAGDYGPTMKFAGLANGTALQRSLVLIGAFIDADRSMTVANSPYHLIFDHIYFITWNVEQITGGAGGVAVLGCATDISLGRNSWRFDGPYQAGSKGYFKGPSVDAPAIHGGDSGMLGVLDVYGGDMRVRRGQTAGLSATVTLDDASWIAAGDIVTGNGLDGDPYALIPQGVTVVGVAGSTVTLSTAVNLPANTSLIFYRCTLADGVHIASSDGLWGEGFMHSICCKENSFRFGSDRQFSNVRVKVMADFAPGASLRFEGAYGVHHSTFYSHHQYGATVVETNMATAKIDWDGVRSSRGHIFDGPVAAAEYDIDGGADYGLQRWSRNGVQRWTSYIDNGAGNLGLNVHDDDGAYLETVYELIRDARTFALNYGLRLSGVTVAQLAALPHGEGTIRFCSNCRALGAGGALEAAGAGTGAHVWKRPDGKWVLLGTNIEAQA